MKKCQGCGKNIDDKYDLCYICNGKQLDGGKGPENRTAQTTKDKSIERQTAAKCTAQLFMGVGYKFASDGVTEQDISKAFHIFLKLIQEGG